MARYANRYDWAKWLFLGLLVVGVLLVVLVGSGSDGEWSMPRGRSLRLPLLLVVAVFASFLMPDAVVVEANRIRIAVGFVQVQRLDLDRLVGVSSNRDAITLEFEGSEPIKLSRNRLKDRDQERFERDARKFVADGKWPEQMHAV